MHFSLNSNIIYIFFSCNTRNYWLDFRSFFLFFYCLIAPKPFIMRLRLIILWFFYRFATRCFGNWESKRINWKPMYVYTRLCNPIPKFWAWMARLKNGVEHRKCIHINLNLDILFPKQQSPFSKASMFYVKSVADNLRIEPFRKCIIRFCREQNFLLFCLKLLLHAFSDKINWCLT